jgi:soluble lytic murein transglycosylase-like protein
MKKEELQALAIKKAEEFELPYEWVFALISIESNWDCYAVRHEMQWRYFYKIEFFARQNNISMMTEKLLQACSFGLCQTMGAVARELGYQDNLLKLTQPEISLHYGCMKLSSLVKKYGYTNDAIASYNAGSVRKRDGKYVNEDYVLKFHNALKGGVV